LETGAFFCTPAIHYFRTAPEQWRDSLNKIKAANLNSISIYIPWNWHVPQEGSLDFTGATHPQRNLIAFLDIAQQTGLYVVFRPGPYICSEWLNGGIPSWLLQKHPEILALDSRGRPSVEYGMIYPPITYCHPVYLEYVQQWYHHVFEAVRPYFSANGGNIINIQLDDEQSYWRTLEQGPLLADYNPVVIGGLGNPNRYGRWLESKYEGISNG
jgi:beta-galactosidase